MSMVEGAAPLNYDMGALPCLATPEVVLSHTGIELRGDSFSLSPVGRGLG